MNRTVTKEFRDINCEIGKRIKEHINNDYPPLNPTQLHILSYLINNEDQDICQKQIEEEMHIKKASVTGSLDSLEEKGLIRRVYSEDDKRKKYIKITQLAKNQRNEIGAMLDNLEKRLINGIGKKELERFLETLNKMKKNLED
ncbi:MAG: MarR family transcriptional regulator [Erysipelotrichaceae bacterium]|nr:MarR family transcriptional regulator [Erysipelotrichaceae bacterium]